ncbi:nucleic acid-binding protein [Natronococcus sp. A-GB1]|uniref:nucleic acid-binding protein n=1 Tax=Natronococcus sp. A-GB1 TaxID=3037648 RepID=UPI00241ED916|nr:nucleic acid-binding protein [Natronococcus sp. A-GB1]MDG5759558.1 nucleic acid-binding protein [Natronococcus sp. A-GB1]
MTMEATRYDDGTISYPGHPRSRNGAEPVETIDLSEYTAEVVTWTTSTATPPGVREPNHLAIVEFDVGEVAETSEGDAVDDGEDVETSVRALVQLTDDEAETGDEVEPVYTEELREPGAGIREPDSQDWDGYRFEPV